MFCGYRRPWSSTGGDGGDGGSSDLSDRDLGDGGTRVVEVLVRHDVTRGGRVVVRWPRG